MNNRSWNDFWESSQAHSGCGASSTQWDAIETAQRPFWESFAMTLPKGARVVDLATGNGVVMGLLMGARRDLRLVGVDLAPRLPAPPKGTRAIAGVAMEALPFGDGTQDAVVGRFGLEYGDVPRVVAEVTRVLRDGGRAAFMCHRLDGPILAHNVPRRAGLQWALKEADLLGKARATLQLRRIGLGIAPALAGAPAEAARRFGQGSAAWEFAEAVVQTLRLGWQDSDAAILEVLATLQAKADNERGRIDSLENACRVAADTARLQDIFSSDRLRVDSRGQVQEAEGMAPFADTWLLTKAAAAVEP
jgi:SAM-dependent methyltransferase